MHIGDAQWETRTRFVGGFYGQILSGVLCATSNRNRYGIDSTSRRIAGARPWERGPVEEVPASVPVR